MEIARVFLDVNMGLGFQGLTKIMAQAGVDPRRSRSTSFIVFINKAGTKFKLLVGNSYLIYFNNGDRKFPLEAIANLPVAFDGNKFNFNRSIEKTIRDKLGQP